VLRGAEDIRRPQKRPESSGQGREAEPKACPPAGQGLKEIALAVNDRRGTVLTPPFGLGNPKGGGLDAEIVFQCFCLVGLVHSANADGSAMTQRLANYLEAPVRMQREA